MDTIAHGLGTGTTVAFNYIPGGLTRAANFDESGAAYNYTATDGVVPSAVLPTASSLHALIRLTPLSPQPVQLWSSRMLTALLMSSAKVVRMTFW